MIRDGRVSVVFFDAMGTILSMRPWVLVMGNEFARLSKSHNARFDDLTQAWSIEWKKVNQGIREVETKPFQTVRELFYEAFTNIGKKLGMRMQQEEIHGIVEVVTNYVNSNAVSYPDVGTTVDELKRRGYRIGVISDADTDDLSLQLRSAGIAGCFETVTTSSEAKSYKPNPRIFEIALEKMNCKPPDACHIGDSQEMDVGGANNVGIHSILVTHGKKELDRKLPKPTHVIKEVNEVVEVLGNPH